MTRNRTERARAKGILRRRTRWLSDSNQEIFEAFRLAVEGDRSKHDRLAAEAMALACILSQELSAQITREGLCYWEMRPLSGGRTWKRLVAHPGLRIWLELHKLLGFTARDLGLTRRQRAARRPTSIADEVMRAREREATRLAGAPPVDKRLN